jgi:phosphonate transport system substrate-binding protein
VKRATLLLLALCGCASARPAATHPSALTVGAVPLDDAARREKQLEALAQYLEGVLHQPVAVAISPHYRAFSQSLSEKRFDLVLVGPVLYSRAHESGYEAVAVAVRGGDANPRGVIVARAGSTLTPQDLKGRKVAFVDPHSASGFQYAFALLYSLGLKPGDYQRSFVGSHDAVLRAVLDGTADAGAVYAGAMVDLLPADRQGQIAVIGQTDPIPGEVFAARVDVRRLQALREALLALTPASNAAVLEPLHAERLVAPTEGQFEGARAIDLLVSEQGEQ